MSCNPSKCKELTIKKRGNCDLFSAIGMIPSCQEVDSLERCAKERYNQSEIDLLFNTIVLPNINYALSVYAASEVDLTPVQCFLDRCFKNKYTSKHVLISYRDKTVILSAKFLMLKDINFYLLCLVLNRKVIILGKRLALNLRLTLGVLKTLNRLVLKYEY